LDDFILCLIALTMRRQTNLHFMITFIIVEEGGRERA